MSDPVCFMQVIPQKKMKIDSGGELTLQAIYVSFLCGRYRAIRQSQLIGSFAWGLDRATSRSEEYTGSMHRIFISNIYLTIKALMSMQTQTSKHITIILVVDEIKLINDY